MIYNFNLNSEPFKSIKNHFKDVEMRTFDARRKCLKVDDYIIFKEVDFPNYLIARIVKLSAYKSFYELYNNYDKCRIGYLPDEIANPDDMLKYYSQELIDKNGALAIEIKLIDNSKLFELVSANFLTNEAEVKIKDKTKLVSYVELEEIVSNL